MFLAGSRRFVLRAFLRGEGSIQQRYLVIAEEYAEMPGGVVQVQLK